LLFWTERVGGSQEYLSRRIGEVFGDVVDTTGLIEIPRRLAASPGGGLSSKVTGSRAPAG
jgi:hypothetical protein